MTDARSFDFGDGPVPAHRHTNGEGWVADTATVEDSAYIGPNARVSGNARVFGNAHVSGNARVFDNAWVSGTGCHPAVDEDELDREQVARLKERGVLVPLPAQMNFRQDWVEVRLPGGKS